METEQQKQLRLIKEQATLIRESQTAFHYGLEHTDEDLNWAKYRMDIEPESVENKFLARLRLLKRCMVECHSSDSMDTMCHTKENYTIDEILSDLDECIKHCIDDVNYNPPKYYLRLCNQLFKYYSKYEKSL